MRSNTFVTRGGFTLMKTPSYRQQAGRRRVLVVCALLALAMASGLIGSLTAQSGDEPTLAYIGPSSYFPSE